MNHFHRHCSETQLCFSSRRESLHWNNEQNIHLHDHQNKNTHYFLECEQAKREKKGPPFSFIVSINHSFCNVCEHQECPTGGAPRKFRRVPTLWTSWTFKNGKIRAPPCWRTLVQRAGLLPECEMVVKGTLWEPGTRRYSSCGTTLVPPWRATSHLLSSKPQISAG